MKAPTQSEPSQQQVPGFIDLTQAFYQSSGYDTNETRKISLKASTIDAITDKNPKRSGYFHESEIRAAGISYLLKETADQVKKKVAKALAL